MAGRIDWQLILVIAVGSAIAEDMWLQCVYKGFKEIIILPLQRL